MREVLPPHLRPWRGMDGEYLRFILASISSRYIVAVPLVMSITFLLISLALSLEGGYFPAQTHYHTALVSISLSMPPHTHRTCGDSHQDRSAVVVAKRMKSV